MSTAGTICVDKVCYKLDVDHAFGQVLVISDGNQAGDTIVITKVVVHDCSREQLPRIGSCARRLVFS